MVKDNEMKGIGNSLDFGARMYDSRLGRWLSLDPLAAKSPGVSSYNFCFNNPIIYNDPDGKYPKIVITDEQTGWTVSKVYGAPIREFTYVVVPTYKMIIYEVKANGKETIMGTHSVTRDGWFSQGEDKDGYTQLVNRTTEPVGNSVTVGAIGTRDFGDTKGAYALQQVTATATPSDWDTYNDGSDVQSDVRRKEPGVATGVMIHIGGYYERNDGSFSIGGTYGCFGVVGSDQIFKNEKDAVNFGNEILNNTDALGVIAPFNDIKPSNNEQNKVVDNVNKAIQKANSRKERNSESIKVEIKKRDNVQTECY